MFGPIAALTRDSARRSRAEQIIIQFCLSLLFGW